MANAANLSELEAAVAKIGALFVRPKPVAGQPGFEAYARHIEREAAIKAIAAQHAAAIKQSKGFNPALGAHYAVADTVAFLADQLEASGGAVVREPWGFRSLTAEEKAARSPTSSMKAA